MNQFDELAETCTAILDLYVQWAKRHGLSANEFFILYMLGHGGACTQKEVSEEWRLPKQTVSFVCKHLESKGWIQSTPDTRDKRGRLICLTPQGKEVVLPMVNTLNEIEMQTAQLFGVDKLSELLTQLYQLHQLFATKLAQTNEMVNCHG